MDCPNNHGQMEKRSMTENIGFRGKSLDVMTKHYVCPECGVRIDDVLLAGENQKALADAYRKTTGLLTSDEIVESRKERGWTQDRLAKEINVGIVSVKRWERGQIQTKAMDDSLRRVFSGENLACNPFTGNRELSFERIKLVLCHFSTKLGRTLLKSSKTGVLYAGKYLFYSDMTAFREIGQSMTGATYARLPQGPQLNNYENLIGHILNADENAAEPLTEQEERIISKIAMAFPKNQEIYKASHKESVWETGKIGTMIPYSDAEKIKAV